jgi:hypothetical protein
VSLIVAKSSLSGRIGRHPSQAVPGALAHPAAKVATASVSAALRNLVIDLLPAAKVLKGRLSLLLPLGQAAGTPSGAHRA